MSAPTRTMSYPVRLRSVANMREHWAAKAKRAKAHRVIGRNAGKGWKLLPCRVTLTRIAPRALDGDNLQSAFKAMRDGVADALGVDDAEPRVEWRYAQERGRVKEYAVTVKIEGTA